VGYPIIRTYRVICDAGVSWTFLQRLIWNRPIDPTFVWKPPTPGHPSTTTCMCTCTYVPAYYLNLIVCPYAYTRAHTALPLLHSSVLREGHDRLESAAHHG